MKSTERLQAYPSPPSSPIDPFEELRNEFYARLQSDRVRLTALGARLARVDEDATSIFEDIRVFAHRLRGAALIFEAAEVGRAANALEQAATSAASANADNSDAAVWAALESLVDNLATLNGELMSPPTAARKRMRSG
jgi:HPt (histidine-containing phosphotransfer) domain-containing protein